MGHQPRRCGAVRRAMEGRAAMTSQSIGFIGLGNMGGRMTRCITAKGIEVLGFDAHAPNIADAGAVAAASSGDVTDRADVVFLSLPDSKVVEAVVLGDDGVLAHARNGQIVIDLSTASPNRRGGSQRSWPRRVSRIWMPASRVALPRPRRARSPSWSAVMRTRSTPHDRIWRTSRRTSSTWGLRLRPHDEASQQLPQCRRAVGDIRGDGRRPARRTRHGCAARCSQHELWRELRHPEQISQDRPWRLPQGWAHQCAHDEGRRCSTPSSSPISASRGCTRLARWRASARRLRPVVRSRSATRSSMPSAICPGVCAFTTPDTDSREDPS